MHAAKKHKVLVTLMKEALSSSETSVLTRATRRNIPEDAILHSHCRKSLKSLTLLFSPGNLLPKTTRLSSPTHLAHPKTFLFPAILKQVK
jgi:hypothetical protein